MCSAVKYSQGQLLRDVWGWTRHKQEQKRKSWRWNGVPDELSRSGVLEETRHVFNAALILRRAIQSLQPSTQFAAEPADLSEEKIDVHVPSELYNFLSSIMTGKGQDTAPVPCLNKRVELDNCFLLMSFLDVLFNSLSFICVTEFSYHFHVVHIAVMCKTYSYQKWNIVLFCSFQSANPKFIHQYHVFFWFYVPSHMHLQIRCAFSNDFSVLMVLTQCLFWFIHIGFFFTLFKESVGFVSFISPMQHSHIHTVFKHCHEQDAMIEKQKFVQFHPWLVKIGEKKQDELKKMSCAVTYNGEGMVEAGIGSEKFLRIRILEILKKTLFFGPSS